MSIASFIKDEDPQGSSGQSGAPASAPPALAKSGLRERRHSIDVGRGYTLWLSFLYIPLVAALKQFPPSETNSFLITQFTHTPWNGFRYVDFGYPSYLFLLAASMVLTYERRRDSGVTRRQFVLQVAWRSLLLWFFACFLYGGFTKSINEIPYNQVFFQLAGCILLTGIAVATLSLRWQIITLVMLLLAQSSIMSFVYVPDYGRGDFSQAGNAQNYLQDQFARFLTRTFWPSESFDYMRRNAISFCFDVPKMFGICLIGLIQGRLLLSDLSRQKQVYVLIGSGIAMLDAGWLWDQWIPINKHLWTPSFTLFTAGVVNLHLAVLMQLSDIWGLRKSLFPFALFGIYPLASWASFYLLPFDNYAQRLFGPGFPPILGAYQPVLLAFTQVGLCWVFIYYLHRLRHRGVRLSA
jgi:predicted acyltransferase